MPTRSTPAATATGSRTGPDVLSVAAASGTAFAAFYCFYSAAPVIFADAAPSPGVRVAVFMAVVVAVQPFVLAVGRWTRSRARVVGAALVAMTAGLALLTVGDAWPGMVLLGAGFGVFVVTATAWVKELAVPDRVGQALGAYGFGSAIGGAIGAPVGLALASQAGMAGVVVGGVAFALMSVVLVMVVAKALAARQGTTTGTLAANRAAEPPVAGEPIVAAHGVDPHTESTVSSASTAPIGDAGARRPATVVLPVSLVGHLLAVTVYAAVLSSAGALADDSTATAAVLVAFAIQSFVALGRLVAGTLADRWSAVGSGLVAAALLTLAVVTFANATAPVIVVASSAVVGLAAGAIQTVALTVMMRRARTAARTDQVSAAWNIAFDAGLGAGGLAAGLLVMT